MMILNFWPLFFAFATASAWFIGRQQSIGSGKKRIQTLSQKYYLGLNYLLNQQPDKAVDVFIKLLEVDSETVETHLALGSLFRRRGEVDRAIRIHQNLIARPQLSEHQRISAMLALGQDYMTAGVLDRAEETFQEVVKFGGEQSQTSLHYLLDIYQQEKAWKQAIAVVEEIHDFLNQETKQIIAYHYCELCEEALKEKSFKKAEGNIVKALKADENSVRASLLKAKLEESQGNYENAIQYYQRVREQDADFISEAIPGLIQCFQQLGREEECLDYLHETLEKYPRISVLLPLAEHLRAGEQIEEACDFMADYLRQRPSIKGLAKLIQWHIETSHGKVKMKLQILQDLTNQLLENNPVYRCGVCGFSGKTLHWLCPSCKEWGSIKPIHGLEGD